MSLPEAVGINNKSLKFGEHFKKTVHESMKDEKAWNVHIHTHTHTHTRLKNPYLISFVNS